MKLYVSDRAPNPRRVLWVRALKGLDQIEIESVDLLTLAHKSHPHLKDSFRSAMPVFIKEDGGEITESLAIARYLESLVPEPNLFGQGADEIAMIEQWTRRLEFHLANPLMLATRLSHPALSVLEPSNPAVADYFIKEAEACLQRLNVHLEGRRYIAADRLTIADIVAVCAIDFVRLIRFAPDKSLEHVKSWLDHMRSEAKILGV